MDSAGSTMGMEKLVVLRHADVVQLLRYLGSG